MDSRTPQQRHANMATIHGKDTKPEMVAQFIEHVMAWEKDKKKDNN